MSRLSEIGGAGESVLARIDAKLIFLEESLTVKGQIISKGLFGLLGFFQKTNEPIHF